MKILGLLFANAVSFHTEEIQYMKRTTRKDFSFDGSFQEAIGSTLVLAQCFGVMPVLGIKSKSAAQLKFQWSSSRTIYSFIIIVFGLFYAGITLWITVTNEIQFVRMSASICIFSNQNVSSRTKSFSPQFH